MFLLQTRKQQVSIYNKTFLVDWFVVFGSCTHAGLVLNGDKGKSSLCSTLFCLHEDTNKLRDEAAAAEFVVEGFSQLLFRTLFFFSHTSVSSVLLLKA